MAARTCTRHRRRELDAWDLAEIGARLLKAGGLDKPRNLGHMGLGAVFTLLGYPVVYKARGRALQEGALTLKFASLDHYLLGL